MIEVKSSTTNKVVDKKGKPKNPATNKDLSDLIDDMAYTALIMQKNGLELAKIQLMVVSEMFELGMEPEKLFESFDFTETVKERMTAFDTLLEPTAKILGQAEEPAFKLINDCKKCEFFEHCIPLVSGYSIFDIPRLQEKQLLELYGQGIVLVKDIPAEYRLTETQKMPVECMRTGTCIIDPGLAKEINKVRWPAHYLDFETTQTAYPLYEKVFPYEKIPTQYSVHTCSNYGEVVGHNEYLAEPLNDNRRKLALKLIEHLDGDGSVFSYSSFEEQVIKGLIERYPDLKEPLTAILNRLVDLLNCSKGVCHPEFRGSNSIKDVLPVLVPAMSYKGMPIANGEDAMVTFAWMARGKFSPEECAKKREEMLRYCELDTLAMVKIHQEFEKLAKIFPG